MYKNDTGIALSMAVWLAHDDYDYNPDKNHVSATGIIKSIRQIILGSRATASDESKEIGGLVASRVGTSIHNQIEKAWINNYEDNLKALGYPQGMIDKIIINPSLEADSKLLEDKIPVYLEVRREKEIEGVKLSGKFDFVIEGRLEDFKSTSTFSYISKSNDAKYALQGSIYRWLNQDIITEDHMAIQFIFLDWKPGLANDPKYPQSKVLEYKIPLMPVAKTETYLKDKIQLIKQYTGAEESTLPLCTADDLWQKASVWKYYKNPAKMTRSTKNFSNPHDAQIRMGQDGGVGTIVEVKGEPTACKYCDGYNLCSQKNAYLLNNTLKL